jgi:hypothetical protein
MGFGVAWYYFKGSLEIISAENYHKKNNGRYCASPESPPAN